MLPNICPRLPPPGSKKQIILLLSFFESCSHFPIRKTMEQKVAGKLDNPCK